MNTSNNEQYETAAAKINVALLEVVNELPQFENGINSKDELTKIELKINTNFTDFTKDDQNDLKKAISLLLGLDGDINITFRKGSVIAEFELPLHLAERFKVLIEAGEFSDYNVLSFKIYRKSDKKTKPINRKFILKQNPIKIVIIDDKYSQRYSTDLLLNGVTDLLNNHKDTELVGGFNDINESVINELKEMEFDIILLDIAFPDDRTKGIQWIKKIKNKIPNVKIIMFSSIFTYSNIKNSLLNEADGFLNKVCDTSELVYGIKTVLNSRQFLCASSTRVLINRIIADELTGIDVIILTVLAFYPNISNQRIEDMTLISRIAIGKKLEVLYRKIKPNKQGLSDWARENIFVSKYFKEIKEFISLNNSLKPENRIHDSPYKNFILAKSLWD